ncbi:C6 transcription factor [Cladophialophora carrionii]|uniref:C6 transcription factor n=1 Tax=Cladophialophora carrionii TaxID=86049 RepID=A0A1C1CM48_9EURO|nr:C6 transcription factor [Cladophialophora carrionii]
MSLSSARHGQPTVQHAPRGSIPPPRQIRFVSTDGQPHTKRRRINTACLTCRKRKTRCSGERPECKTCTDYGHECSGYADRPSREDGRVEENDEEEVDHGVRTSQTLSNDVDATARVSDTVEQSERERRTAVDDIISPASNHTGSSFTSSRNRVPYFRYFGPTAIVPGFKQMVVQIKDHQSSLPSAGEGSPASGQPSNAPVHAGHDRAPVVVPFYDATDPDPVAPLIVHLCDTFFIRLGCNYPFLQRERFLKDLEERKVDAILVDAVCAVAARFSSHSLLCTSKDPSVPVDDEGNVLRAFRGQPFAQRAMSAVIDTFSCPTIAVAQACLLLAYEEFGTDHDSGLWMYLGTAIRMAQDLGMQKLEGLQLEGRIGPTPKTVKHGQAGKVQEQKRFEQQRNLSQDLSEVNNAELDDRRASEQERVDTFWAIFFLDRAVSSGVGRPVTLRDKDIEISFPYRADKMIAGGYPDPFPAMIQIVHMYGRVADVLNNIKDVSQVTPEVLKRLASMERDLTGFYQRLSPKLHFNATNFQQYVKAGHGTNFILLHFWFHTLIVLVHQPTLLHSFEGRIQQLFPDSRELSMSSAKTIADILAFAELIDLKSFVGNPFTSQPMYVAACAFLAEAAAHTSQPSSRATSPRPNGYSLLTKHATSDEKAQKAASARHTLLATAANQNYQRCYKALQTLDSYWAGCRYILTALDQKSKGLMDPLLFTAEDVDGQMPSTQPSFTTPGWRRSTSLAASLGVDARFRGLKGRPDRGTSSSPSMDLSHAIGWSLTGTANSPAPNLSFLYSMNDGGKGASFAQQPPTGQEQSGTVRRPANRTTMQDSNPPSAAEAQLTGAGQVKTVSSLPYDPVSTEDADLLLGLHSPYTPNSAVPATATSNVMPPNTNTSNYQPQLIPGYEPAMDLQQQFVDVQSQDVDNMLIRAQEIDMSGAQQFDFAFPGGDMIPWLEYLPPDVLTYFGDQHSSGDMIDTSGSLEHR